MKSPVKFSLPVPASMALITHSPQSLYCRNRVFQALHMKKVSLLRGSVDHPQWNAFTSHLLSRSSFCVYCSSFDDPSHYLWRMSLMHTLGHPHTHQKCVCTHTHTPPVWVHMMTAQPALLTWSCQHSFLFDISRRSSWMLSHDFQLPFGSPHPSKRHPTLEPGRQRLNWRWPEEENNAEWSVSFSLKTNSIENFHSGLPAGRVKVI